MQDDVKEDLEDAVVEQMKDEVLEDVVVLVLQEVGSEGARGATGRFSQKVLIPQFFGKKLTGSWAVTPRGFVSDFLPLQNPQWPLPRGLQHPDIPAKPMT